MKAIEKPDSHQATSPASYLVEVGDDIVEKAETVDSLVVPIQRHVELGEVGNRDEGHAHFVISLAV